MLKFIGKVLQDAIRAGDIACRFGGEEFVVVLIDSSVDNAKLRIKQISRRLTNETLTMRGIPLPHVTISVGIAAAPAHGSNIKTLLSAADKALYTAKGGGKDRVEIFQLKKRAILAP